MISHDSIKKMEQLKRPDLASKCTWALNSKIKSPHSSIRRLKTEKVIPNILHTVGNTPMIKLNCIPKKYGIKCNVFGKCEFFNPGGSVKDRIALRMIEEAENKGILKPGDVIIEPTSGKFANFTINFYLFI